MPLLPLQKQDTPLSTLITHLNPLFKCQLIPKKKAKSVCCKLKEKYQEEEVRHQKLEVEAFKMCLEEDELSKALFAVLIPTLIATTILYILMMRPLPYEEP
jgi:hypothetical protein